MLPRTIVPLTLSRPLNRIVIHEPEHPGLAAHFERAKAAGYTAWDLETNVTDDFWKRKARTCQFGNLQEQFVVDLLSLCDGDADLLAQAQGEYGKHLHIAPKLKQFIEFCDPILCDGIVTKGGVNLGFEYGIWYFNFGRRTWKFWDCSMVEKAIYAGSLPLKTYALFSMEAMTERYLGMSVDKTLQTSFNLVDPLSDAQADYTCYDIVLPTVIKSIQGLILNGRTLKNNTNPANTKYLQWIDPLVTGDDLNDAARIENECIGAFMDMHLHGERIDREKWKKRIADRQAEFEKVLTSLDEIFVPIVGNKTDIITDEMIEASKAAWKVYAVEGPAEKALKAISPQEMELRRKINAAKKAGDIAQAQALQAAKDSLAEERARKREAAKDARNLLKEPLKLEASNLSKRKTRQKRLLDKCEGLALINYKSDAQLLAEIKKMKGLKSVRSMGDEVLEAHAEKFPVMALIQRYHGLSKEIGTYGNQWATEWVTKPCKKEGWLHPCDGRLHCVFNQFDAETGRSSSEKPNGQNLPQDFDVRSCFIADPPDESIRICRKCQSECFQIKSLNLEPTNAWLCGGSCGEMCYGDTDPEEWVLVTADMSGAELRIIAELAGDPIWIGAFERGEDVHSVGTELLQGERWTKETFIGGEIYYEKDDKGNEIQKVGKPCAYYAINSATGKSARKKCKCPGHAVLRNRTKAVNFLLAYGGGPQKLAQELKISVDEAKELMALHEKTFPRIWAYLEKSGTNAKLLKKSFDLFGGRRLFPKPTRERAIERCIEKDKERKEEGRLLLKPWLQQKNIDAYVVQHGVQPKGQDLYDLTHRRPTEKEITNSYMALHGNIERQGKNHAIQGSNARIAKIAMGCGFDADDKPFLWHLLPQYKAKLIKFVHDELVVLCPKRYGNTVADLIKEAYKRAAWLKMKLVVMESDANVEVYWSK